MKCYLNQNESAEGRIVVLDDMMLTTEFPTTGGSKMLDGYLSLFEAEVVTRLKDAGYSIGGKANVGEFASDFLGETSYFGACADESGKLTTAAAELLETTDAVAAVGLEVNGAIMRSAALNGQVCIKPTYGTVSRYGTIAVACSGETVCVTAKSAEQCKEVLGVISGHDDKDGTSLSEDCCKAALQADAPIKRIALAGGLASDVDEQTRQWIASAATFFASQDISVCEIDDELFRAARVAWNILMSAELCNNVSRFDGVKYGYRCADFSTIDELYTNSRTEAFGLLLKTAILYGSESLSTENYDKLYDKSLRVRRVLHDRFEKIFEEYDAVLMPVCDKSFYSLDDIAEDPCLAFTGNEKTSPTMITGLPSVVFGGVQLIGKPLSDGSLLDIAERFQKEVR